MRMLSLNGRREVAAEQVSLILGKNFVLSFREQNSDIFDPIVERIKSGKASARPGRTISPMHLLDAVMNHYFVVLEKREEEIDASRRKSLPSAGTSSTSGWFDV